MHVAVKIVMFSLLVSLFEMSETTVRLTKIVVLLYLCPYNSLQ